ncbi:unnamed protein product [Meganyctiphanes norvegica]|uniref:Uncharacterized protein n=1 Tax=Meganyctiphanes norvegica TaxID=48144 RepID=A0AAV2S3N1_MEGNR
MNDLVMGADQFLLTWNNHRSNFAEVFSQLRVQEQLVDVTLLCDGGSYPAHRLVLAACSPYFHQLFTRLPTQHPLVYLRDVKQAELEALLEFIYRGEVSVANSELTGLIKIAESLRIKGLGDVSQRNPHNITTDPRTTPVQPHTFPPSPPPTHTPLNRPRKAPKLHNGNAEAKAFESNFASLLSPANSYGHALNLNKGKGLPAEMAVGFAQMMADGMYVSSDLSADQDNHSDAENNQPTPTAAPWESNLTESKLRSCLEGLDAVARNTASPLLTVPRTPLTPSKAKTETGKVTRRREKQEKRQTGIKRSSSPMRVEAEEIETKPDIKTEAENEEEDHPVAVTTTGPPPPMTAIPLYGNDLTSPLLASYRHMLSLSAAAGAGTGGGTDPDHRAFSPLIPTTIQEAQHQDQQQQQQQVPSPTSQRDPNKSLTCQLCGATIKHIANFRRHMKQHLNPRRFPCPWCTAAFGRKDNLKTHTRKHHPNEVEATEVPGDGTAGISGGTGGSETGTTGLNGTDGVPGIDEANDDSSDHHESLVIAEESDDDDDDDDSRMHIDDTQ